MSALQQETTDQEGPAPGGGGPEEFALIWTIGFAGKRLLPDAEKARQAVRTKLQMLLEAAAQEHVRLVSVSSLAIGGDLIFAEECLSAGIPWRGILPFETDEFLKDDFTEEDAKRFHKCVDRAYRMDIAPVPAATIQDGGIKTSPLHTNRQRAYLDAGYRIIENSDVVLLVTDHVRGGPGGSVDTWHYAEALSKPIWRWDPNTGKAEKHGWPGEPGPRHNKRLFHDEFVAGLMASAVNPKPLKEMEMDTERQRSVRKLFHRLDGFADAEQAETKSGLQGVLTLHLTATLAAGATFTFFSGHPHAPLVWFILFIIAATAKPVLACLAWRLEDTLHRDRHQDLWADARVGAELCRSMLASWNMPQDMPGVFDVEDFPRFRRLIRSLVLTRTLDHKEVRERWTLDGAAAVYVTERLLDQAEYCRKRRDTARANHEKWQKLFYGATGYVIVAGAFLAFEHIHEPAHEWLNHHIKYWQTWEDLISCLLIVAPFTASYALALQTINDTRRRLTRYDVQEKYLKKQIERLGRTRSDVARLRLVAATERMLVQELHEWDSVARHVKV